MDPSESNVFTCTICSEEFDTVDKHIAHKLLHEEVKVEIESDSETNTDQTEQLRESSDNLKCEDQMQAEQPAKIQAKSNGQANNKAKKVYNTRSSNKSMAYVESNDLSGLETQENSDSDYIPGDEHKKRGRALVNVEPKRKNNEQGKPKLAQLQQKSVPSKTETSIAIPRPKVLSVVKCETTSVKVPFINSKKIKFFCKYCSNFFNTIEIVTKHMDASHNKQPEFNCLLCPSKFCDYQLLRQHFHSDHMGDKLDDYMENALSTENRAFECKECCRVLRTARALRTHKLRIHDKKNHVQCDVCKGHFHKLFFFKHKQGGHCAKKMDLDSVVCDQCGKTLRTRHLHSHMKIHSNVLHECNVCKKKYRYFNTKRLCEDKHANIRRYKCKLCTKAFFYAGSLVHHNRLHTGEKPYGCWICSRSFCSHQTLLKHCLSHGVSSSQFRTEFKKRNGKSW